MKIKTLSATIIISLIGMILSGCGINADEITYTGIVEGEIHTISSPVSDRLVALSVSEGDWVEKGKILGNIDDNFLKLQLKGLYSSWDQLKLQKKDGAISLEQISESFDHYNSMYQKNLALLQQEAVSDQTVKDLKLQVDKWNRDRRSVAIKLQVLSSQEESIQYQIAQIEDTRAKAILTASTDGYIDKIYFEAEEFIPPLRPVMDLVNLNNVWCYIYLSESELVEISPGDPAEGRVADHLFAGRVRHINSKSEFSPKEILSPDNRKALVYAVKISFENPDRILKIGMPIDVYLKKNNKKTSNE
ncbi:MAG: efflux RND transporter periplasmic adaptor subunit [Spirochaetia bacterium]|jgi:HlyD family secretion protein|nr:efflux RND transporter periplasmic adaptor subunit [Spirochaetia bacterium]